MADALTLWLMTQHPAWYGRMYRNASYNTSATYVQFPFDTIDYDPSGSCTTGASANVTVPATGLYSFASSTVMLTTDASESVQWQLCQNGSTVRIGDFQVATPSSLHFSVSVKCTAGDIFSVWYYAPNYTIPIVIQNGSPYTWIEWSWLRSL
jgi:hypothetical protein